MNLATCCSNTVSTIAPKYELRHFTATLMVQVKLYAGVCVVVRKMNNMTFHVNIWHFLISRSSLKVKVMVKVHDHTEKCC